MTLYEKVWQAIIGVALIIIALIMLAIYCTYEMSYQHGYFDACEDFYQGKLNADFVTVNGQRNWKFVKK